MKNSRMIAGHLREEFMEMSSKASMKSCSSAAVVVFTLFAMLVPNSSAKDRPTERVIVVAHLTLPGTAVNRMLLLKQGRKRYLRIQQADKPDLVVDVTKADRPNMVNDVALNASSKRLQMVDSEVGISEVLETFASGNARHVLMFAKRRGTTGSGPATEAARVLDLSDPKNPKTLQTFDGVTSVLADDWRELIYVSNRDGFWILKRVEVLPSCDSESAFSEIAYCR
jgi:hypothetical protein